MVAQVSKKQTEIQQAVIFRVSDKATGTFLGYKVKSDSSEDYYEVTWNEERQIWACNCKSVKPCKHCRAASQVCQAKVEIAKQGNTSPATVESQIVNIQIGNTTISEPISNLGNAVAHHIWAKRLLAGVQEEPARKAEREARLQREADEMVAEAGRKYNAPLNGQGGFSLLRV